MKKLLLVTIFIFTTLYGMSAYAADPVATAYFYDKGVVLENLEVVSANNPIYKNGIKDGIHGWFMDVYKANNSINFSVLNATKEDYGKNYRLDVKYYDEKSGYFTLIYNTSDGQKTSEHILLTGSNEWKIHSFYMYDACFNKSVYGSNDFRLTVYDPEYTYSDFGVLVSEVKLYSMGTKTTTMTKMTASGNDTIFFDNEEIRLDFVVKNKGETFDGLVSFKVIDDNGKVICSEQINVRLNNGENSVSFKPDVNAYGVFKAEVKVESLQNKYEELSAFSFSKIDSSYGETLNRDFGATIHLGYSWRTYDEELHTTLIKNSGMGIVRDEINWDVYEKEKGVYKLLDNHIRELEALKKKDIDVLLILGFSNPLYVKRENGAGKNYPVSKEELKAFYDYVFNLVKDTKDYVKYYEVWNEYNHSSQNLTTEEYVNILKTAYRAAKSANPDCKIVGMALCSVNPVKELEKAIELGAMDYMDIVSTHYYSVNEQNRGPEKSYLNTELGDIKNLCQDKELWLTEIGWGTYHKGLSDIEGASYASRTLLWNAYKKFADKVFWYDWHDDGTQKNNIEHNYGMLENDYSAKRVYAAVSSYNKNIASAIHSDVTIYDNTYMHKLVRQNGNNIYAVYNYKNETKEIKFYTNADKVTLSDNYGTKKEITVENGMFKTEISYSPIYIETSGEEVYAEYNLASVTFENGASEQYGMEITENQEGTAFEIFADVTSIGDFKGYKNLEVDVTYKDAKDGFCVLSYDSADGEKDTETVYTKGTEKFINHTFVLQNVRFNNAIDSLYDFKISALAEIKSITLRDSDKISAVEIEVEDVLFNINEPQNIKVKLKNSLNEEANVSVRYTVFTENGEKYKVYEKKIQLENSDEFETVLKTAISDFGKFLLKIEVIDEENNLYSQKHINITVQNTSFGRYNLEKLGIKAEIDDLSKIKNSGAKTLYTKLLWNEIEKETGVFELSENFLKNIKQLNQEGFEIIIETDCFNNLYDKADKNAFRNYISALANSTSKYCDVFALRCNNDMNTEQYISFAETAKDALESSETGIILATEEVADDYGDLLILNSYHSVDKPVILSYNGTENVLKEYLRFIENCDSGLFLIENIDNKELAKLSAMSSILENSRFKEQNLGIYNFEDKAYVISSDENAVLNTGYKNIAFFDEYGNFIKEETSEDGSYMVNAEEKIFFAVETKEKVWIDYPKQAVFVKDYADDLTEQNVNITVFNENSNPLGIVYLNQKKTDKNGKYEFAFDISNGKGLYKAVVTDNNGFKKEYNIEINRIVKVDVQIEDESGTEITKLQDITDLKSEKLYVFAELDNEFNVNRECMLLVCGYKDNVLEFCNIEKGSLNNSFELNLSLEIDTDSVKNSDSIKIFVWDENSLESLTDYIHLN